eukprot:CAMPEP_0171943660 /NCGR_PEP_ID=MMETSP0993-20121228/39671_1 /TAXON_ID=483369 /ORGANISM="non described non described, Strain CCMP2098" /LENGTH=238 /DNA_ID=CAMNT_0012586303 /DNA_START=374 /DNA_END=1091 /DNA_ORIENTATION=-
MVCHPARRVLVEPPYARALPVVKLVRVALFQRELHEEAREEAEEGQQPREVAPRLERLGEHRGGDAGHHGAPRKALDATARMPTEEGKLQTVSPSSFVLHSPGKIRAVKNAMTPVPRKRADHMHMIFAAESPLRNMMLADDIASGKLARKTAMMKAIESLPSDCMNPMSMDSGIPSMRIPSQMLNATLLGGFPSASSPSSSPVPLLTVEYSSSSPASFFALAETEFEAPAVRIRFTTM